MKTFLMFARLSCDCGCDASVTYHYKVTGTDEEEARTRVQAKLDTLEEPGVYLWPEAEHAVLDDWDLFNADDLTPFDFDSSEEERVECSECGERKPASTSDVDETGLCKFCRHMRKHKA